MRLGGQVVRCVCAPAAHLAARLPGRRLRRRLAPRHALVSLALRLRHRTRFMTLRHGRGRHLSSSGFTARARRVCRACLDTQT